MWYRARMDDTRFQRPDPARLAELLRMVEGSLPAFDAIQLASEVRTLVIERAALSAALDQALAASAALLDELVRVTRMTAELDALRGGYRLREGALYGRELADGYDVTVYPMLLGRARLCLGTVGDDCNVHDAWCYDDPTTAVRAAAAWSGDGDPADGWTRHINSGRRRPGGDPSKETVER